VKLYTKPRPIDAWRLRPGDQIAVNKRRAGTIINSETAYMDADLDERVAWSVVHASFQAPASVDYLVTHTLGENELRAGATVIVREVIEIDPWTYVQRPPDGP
jgi:hypothetical protein